MCANAHVGRIRNGQLFIIRDGIIYIFRHLNCIN